MAATGDAEHESGLEGRAAFGGFIGPRRLVSLVQNTAPYLFDQSSERFAQLPETTGERLHQHADHPLGWWSILRRADSISASPSPSPEEWTDYFALCVSAHFGSCASYVPTDVDTKIRAHLWYEGTTPEELSRRSGLALQVLRWDISPISARIVHIEEAGDVSGHDGERLSILCGGLLALLRAGDQEGAARFEHEIDAELSREAKGFQVLSRKPGRERALLTLAAAMTHNAGDVDQGLSAREGKKLGETQKIRFGRLAHERPERYAGAFAKAALLYKECMAAEGHRHYPLRDVRSLRQDPELLLPVGPYFDDWGKTLAKYPRWNDEQRAEALDGVITACRRVKGQMGYYRALAGFDRTYPGGIDAPNLGRHLAASTRRDLKDADLRRLVAIRQESFESSLAKRTRALLGS